MRVQLKTNYLTNDSAPMQTNNNNSNPNFASTWQVSVRAGGSQLILKGLRAIFESFKPTSIKDISTQGHEFASHLVASFPEKMDAEIGRLLALTLKKEPYARCHRVPWHDLNDNAIQRVNLSNMPVWQLQ